MFQRALHHGDAAEARRDRSTAQIAAMLPDWTLVLVVVALQTTERVSPLHDRAAALDEATGHLPPFA